MNEVVRKHYPASRLPDDLRHGIAPSSRVTVTVVEEDMPEEALTLEEIFALRRGPYLSKQEIDDHVRSLRDEWE